MKPNLELSVVPKDFSLKYEWRAGSMPPPAHYEYTIRITRDGGEITFYPDYPSHQPPIWKEQFVVPADTLNSFYSLLVDKQILTRQWQSLDDPAVGGSLESLDVTANGGNVSVPCQLNRHDAALLRRVYAALRTLVPPSLWDDLLTRREKFRADYFAVR